MTGLTSVTLAKLPFREVARLAAEAGAECVEWSAKAHAVSVAAAKEIAEESAARGLACTGLGSYFRVGVSPARDFDELTARANALGTDHIRVWLGGKSSRRTSDGEYAALLASAREICDKARAAGVTVSAEFHRGTFNDCAAAWQRFDGDLGEEIFATYWQPFYRSRREDIENLVGVRARVTDIHLFYWTAAGLRLPLAAGGKALAAFSDNLVGFDGNVLLEFTPFDSPKQMKKDMATLADFTRKIRGGDGL